ncbi:flagellar filament capping protein FliD [Burkholderia sp. Ac-20379]|uniref:flagellar filament capping protein FliD n=1 Tax=Burkholderia sp. Ac-20379 TaxID=2703900 RepID=UPI00197FB160|nr:flagellar filament capping protein FliD [Burkholderia sp. Ac-20379]MBN3727009.1 flagellar filament capping protein FliD [Burkholderia sp. Ac-20379]
MSIHSTANNAISGNSALQQAAQSIISGSTGNSSIDVNTLVTALVNSKTAGQNAILSTAVANDNNRAAAYTSLQTALRNLQGALSSLSDGSFAQTFTTAAAGGTGLTATAGNGAVAGSYQVAVNQIAQSQSLTSPAFAANQALGTGSITLSVNGKSSTLALDASNNTLSGIAAAINNQRDNPGVTASIVTGSDGAHLVLRSNNSGAANTIDVKVAATTDNGLSNLAVGSTPSTTGGPSTISTGSTAATKWAQSSAAQDASVTVNGVTNLSATNAVGNVIAGVTLNLTQAAVTTPATTQTLTISTDTAKQAAALTSFVSSYNTLVQTIATVGAFDNTNPAKPLAGPLFGDSTLNTIRTQMQSILGSAVNRNGVGATLQQLGITVADGTKSSQASGTLIVDQAALTRSLANHPTAAATLFDKTAGLGAQIDHAITSYTAAHGILTTSASGVQTDLKGLTAQQTSLQTYAASLSTRYNAQFTALNNVMSQMNRQQNYLTALFGGTKSAGALATNKR